jgi:hypothetical protein
MPNLLTQARAAELQRHLAHLTGHELAQVRPYGKHLLIQMLRDDNTDTVARLTELARGRYRAAFRSHTGRWEPLPIEGDLKQAADALTTLLAPYFDPKT